MFSKKKNNKTVISITDTTLSYITLERNERGFFVNAHETVDLPEETIVQGEILKADLLYKILKELNKKIKNPNVDVLFPHDYFLCSEGNLDSSHKQDSLKKRVTRYFEEVSKKESWHETHVCEFSQHTLNGKDKVLFTCLPQDIHKSYVYVFKKSGLIINSFNSNILAFDHLIKKERTSLVAVAYDSIRIAEFKDGMYLSHKTFQASYHQFIQDIVKNLDISESDAWDILLKFGILRAHKDEKVFKRLIRSFSPVLEFMSQRKIKGESNVQVVFFKEPIPGLIDTLKRALHIEVHELDSIKTNDFTFQDILTLHRKESYQYQALIAQALKYWRD